MRGADRFTESLFTLSRLEDFIPADHPLRPIRAMVNQALGQMDALFSSMYATGVKGGRPSIAPEKLIRAMLRCRRRRERSDWLSLGFAKCCSQRIDESAQFKG